MNTHHVFLIVILLLAADAATNTSPAADLSASASLTGPSTAWLAGAGQSAEWRAATQPCRELLQRLDPQAPRVQPYLPQVKEHVQLLLRTADFDWRKRTAVDYLRNLLEDLLAGREPHQRYAGQGFAFPYWSGTMKRIEAIWVHMPPSYSPTQRHALFLYYKCGGGIHQKDGKVAGGYRPTTEVANQTDTFHAWSSLDIQIKGRYGGAIEAEEFPAAFCREFAVDPDRFFLSGWSDGGFTALMVAAHHPHLVAGIVPVCANWQYANVENVALRNIPVLAVDGWGDGDYNELQFQRWQSLRGWEADAACVWGHHGHSYQPYEDVATFQRILEWAKTKQRNPWPKQVHYATWNLAWNRAYWVYLDRLADPLLAGHIAVQVKEDNRIEVKTGNLAAYHLMLNAKLVDPRKRITVITDGRESYAGAFKDRIDVELIPPPGGRFVKSAAAPDEITAILDSSEYRRSDSDKNARTIPGRTWLAVRGTAADAATAALLEKWYPQGAKADREVTDADLAEHNLLLYGGPNVNTLTARIAAELPVKFGKGQFTLGSTVYDQPTHCVAFLHPNPLNPRKHVIIYAFNDAAAFAANGYFDVTGLREFRSGDAMVRGIPSSRARFGVSLPGSAFETRHVLFGPDWQVDQRPALGEATRTFDYLQLLRLRADALREAAGVDVGIVWGHTPSWNRWTHRLAAGPITRADLATQNDLPDYVCVGEMQGSELLGRRGGVAAWSLRAAPSETTAATGPALTLADIDPGKTYRVAFPYRRGGPAYGADSGKMPKLFSWATSEEFLTGPGARIPVRNLVQTPLQTAEAVAQYVQKHRRITPRPLHTSLTEYIANPLDNEYDDADWLHLGMDADWMRAGQPSGVRYTLNLGVAAVGQAKGNTPRKNTKHFAELPLMDRPASMAFHFGVLDRKLPLVVASKWSRHAITRNQEGQSYALAAAGAPSAMGQAILVEFQLTNPGPADLSIKVVLADTVLRDIYGQVWFAHDPSHLSSPSGLAALARSGRWKRMPNA